MASISAFLEEHFRHFNARETLEASRAYRSLIENGGRVLMSLGGAMSTAELGKSLSKMIRQDKVHAISATAANLEEDIFNLIGHNDYKIISKYRYLNPADEVALRDKGFNRVTDTCIPESVIDVMEEELVKRWSQAAQRTESYFPFEYIYQLIEAGIFDDKMQVPPENSWVLAACEKQIPIYTPAFEDSTLGNIFTAHVVSGDIKDHSPVKSGTMQFEHLIQWYKHNSAEHPTGFFQIGGGVSADFAICVVPCIRQDLRQQCDLWSYFCQIGDAVASYGSYSGAPPNEKITWHKLDENAPAFAINSDATIVAPLIFAYVLGE